MQHIVFGLDDAMPRSVPSSLADAAKRADWADREFDRGHGSRLLANRIHAAEVERCLLQTTLSITLSLPGALCRRMFTWW